MTRRYCPVQANNQECGVDRESVGGRTTFAATIPARKAARQERRSEYGNRKYNSSVSLSTSEFALEQRKGKRLVISKGRKTALRVSGRISLKMPPP